MLFGLDGVEIGLIIVFLCLFGGILSGFPVAFAIGGAGVVAFAIIAGLDSAGILIHQGELQIRRRKRRETRCNLDFPIPGFATRGTADISAGLGSRA